MAKLKAVGAGPIGLTDDEGTQHFIPLSWVVFDSGAIKLEAPVGALSADLSAAVGKWLDVLRVSGMVTSEPEPPPTAGPVPPVPPAAMVISAKNAGVGGNDIKVKVLNVRESLTTPGTKVFDATVSETDVHKGLTPATVKQQLGSAAGQGVVFVSSSGTPTAPKPGEYSFTAGAATTDRATADIPDKATPPGVAFQLSTRAGDADALLTKVTISEDPAHPNTFDLTATWSKSAEGLKPADFGPAFAYAVTVAQAPAPPGGGPQPPLGVPAEGEYTLSGGAENAAATNAQAQLPVAP